MQAFARVYETGSFSGAARRLQMGQPSVSKLVAQLENHLGAELLLRSTRGLSPTEAGKRFYENALRTLEAAEVAERSARGEDLALSGRLRVSGTISFMHRFVVPRLATFYAAHPGIEIDLLLDDRNIGLVEEGVEVALRIGKLASSEMTAKKIGQTRRVVVGSTTYFAAHGVPKKPADLVQHRAVVYSRLEGGDQATFTRGGRAETVTLRPRLRVDVLEGVRSAVLAGLGLAVATEWIFGPELYDGQLKEVLSDWELPSISLWAVIPGGKRASAKAKAFVAFVEHELSLSPFAVRASESRIARR